MTTWLLPPKSGATFTTANRSVIVATLGAPVPFEDSDVATAIAQGWSYSATSPVEQLGKLNKLPVTANLDSLGNVSSFSVSELPLKLTKEIRDENISLNKASPLILATAWTTGEVVATGDIRRVTSGQTITYQTAGTTGTIEPVLGGRSTINASVATTTTLTVNTVTGDPIGIGTEILTGGVTAGTRISAFGTGTGGAGTYTLTGNSVATVASTNMAVIMNPAGRPITDGTAIGYQDYITKLTTEINAPNVLYAATANLTEVTARYGLTRVTLGSPDYNIGSQLLYLRSKCGVDGVIPFVAQSIDYRIKSTSSTYDAFAAAYGYPIGMSRSSGLEYEFIVTDTAFGLEFNSGSGGHLYVVTVNGQIVNGTPVRTNNGNSQVIVYDFDNKLTRAVVRLRPCIIPESRISAIHITPLGKLENGVKSQDTLLCLGDSMWDTISPVSNGQSAFNLLGINLKNNLGFESVVVANGGGTGYIATAGNFTLPQMVSDPTNQQLFKSYNTSHVVIGTSLNDNTQTPSAVAAAALTSWQTLRNTLPNAKITICDAWYHEEDGTLANRRAIATALKNQFILWGDSNSRFVTFHGASGTNSVIFGTGNTTSTTTSTTTGTRARIIGSDNTHFGIYGVSFMSDYLSNAIDVAWTGNY
jgi:hypothetical protein